MFKDFRKIVAIVMLTSLSAGSIAFADSGTVSKSHSLATSSNASQSEDIVSEDEIVSGNEIPSGNEILSKDELLSEDEMLIADDIPVKELSARMATPSDAKYLPAKGQWAVDDDGNVKPGWISWDTEWLSETEKDNIVGVDVRIYKEEKLIGAGIYDGNNKFGDSDVRYHFKEDGDYTFRAVYMFERGMSLPDDQYSEMSETYSYTRPTKSLSSPTGLIWQSGQDIGRISWNAVTGGNGRQVYWPVLYKRLPDSSVYIEVNSGGLTNGTSTNRFLNDLNAGENEVYKFKVFALGDLIEYDHSVSEFSPEFYMGDVSEAGNTIIEAIMNGDIQENVENTVLSADEKGSLKLAVQADKDVAQNYEALEAAYKESTATDDFIIETNLVELEQSRIKVVGGILNGATGIKFEKPSAEDLEGMGVSGYQARTSINITLDGTGDGELNYPVLITMPVPTGISHQALWIIHMKHDGTKEIIRPRINEDGTVSFAVSEFSIFHFAVLGDEEIDDQDNQGNTGGGSGRGSGGGSSRSITIKTIPQTPGSWLKTETGWLFRTADGFVYMNEWLYVGNCWYYAGPTGQIVEGWQLINNVWYYFTLVNGDMLANTRTPDGYYVGADGAWNGANVQ